MMMQRLLAAAIGALASVALAAGPSAAAMDITVSVSPGTGVVGRPVEVLVRTFVPIEANGLDLPVPSLGYPTQSGLWEVLYPFPDYPFDIVAKSPAGAEVQVILVRDGSDASLWRGAFTPTVTGQWSIVVKNFPKSEPTRLEVTSGDSSVSSWVIAVAALLLGLGGGLLAERGIRRARHGAAVRA
jgi:hypothetical protein